MSIVFERDPWRLTPRVSPESAPLITAFDVHGSPERKSPERAAVEAESAERVLVTADGREVPRWMVRMVHGVAWCVAVPLLPVVWLAMRFRRPRLRVVNAD